MPLHHTECFQSLASPLYELCNTYDLPPSCCVEYACPTSQFTSLSLENLIGAKMKDYSPLIMERSSSSASRSSLGPVKRSVPGMKSLMPLKLLSPTASELGTWPSPEPIKRSTFGTETGSLDCKQSSNIGNRARDSLKSPKMLQQYRDTPIYNQPGSPIPSRAYYLHDDVSFNCSQPASMCDTNRVIQELSSYRENRWEDQEHSVQEAR